MYKLQFFTFIFAVLLPVLSRLLIMSINTAFSTFQDGGSPPSKIFKSSKYQLLVWRAIHYYVRTYENFLSYDSSDRAYIYARIYDFSYVPLRKFVNFLNNVTHERICVRKIYAQKLACELS